MKNGMGKSHIKIGFRCLEDGCCGDLVRDVTCVIFCEGCGRIYRLSACKSLKELCLKGEK